MDCGLFDVSDSFGAGLCYGDSVGVFVDFDSWENHTDLGFVNKAALDSVDRDFFVHDGDEFLVAFELFFELRTSIGDVSDWDPTMSEGCFDENPGSVAGHMCD